MRGKRGVWAWQSTLWQVSFALAFKLKVFSVCHSTGAIGMARNQSREPRPQSSEARTRSSERYSRGPLKVIKNFYFKLNLPKVSERSVCSNECIMSAENYKGAA